MIVAVLAVGAGAGLYWFQPWKLVTDQRVDDSLDLPAQQPAGTAAPTPPAGATPSAGATTVPPATGPVVVRAGTLISHEHTTTGTARVVRRADGSLRLELVDLNTSNGPDLRVWLSDQKVQPGRAGWGVFDDGQWVELGRLKGNQGDQSYAVPAGTDLEKLSSVTIWCKRFSVSFGAATLQPA